jgi:exonuclease III
MAAVFQIVKLVNIYAPSGAERRSERETFFSRDLSYLLQGVPKSLLVGGDFNSILTNADAMGHQNYSRPLQELIRGFDLVNMWETSHGLAIYTQ